MKKIAFIFGVVTVLFFLSGLAAWAKEVPYTLEDRDRLIRIETSLREFKESVDKRIGEFRESVDRRFEQVDRRFEEIITFMWILGSVFGGLVAVTVGIAVWDRRTALAPALRRSQQVEEREERIERALKELAQKDPNVAEALRHAGLL